MSSLLLKFHKQVQEAISLHLSSAGRKSAHPGCLRGHIFEKPFYLLLMLASLLLFQVAYLTQVVSLPGAGFKEDPATRVKAKLPQPACCHPSRWLPSLELLILFPRSQTVFSPDGEVRRGSMQAPRICTDAPFCLFAVIAFFSLTIHLSHLVGNCSSIAAVQW